MKDARSGWGLVAGLVGALALLGAFTLGSTRAVADDKSGSATTAKAETMVMAGIGAVTGVPDELSFTVGVSSTEPDVSAAMQASNLTMKRVFSALQSLGVKKADIASTGLSIDPVYDYSYNTERLVGYAVRQRARVRVTDLGKAGKAMTAAVQAGGNAVRIHGVALDIGDRDGLLAQARKAAVADAMAKAKEYAAAAGRDLGQVISIREVSTRAPEPLQATAYRAAAKGLDAAAVPIRAGRQDLTVRVRVVWSLG